MKEYWIRIAAAAIVVCPAVAFGAPACPTRRTDVVATLHRAVELKDAAEAVPFSAEAGSPSILAATERDGFLDDFVWGCVETFEYQAISFSDGEVLRSVLEFVVSQEGSADMRVSRLAAVVYAANPLGTRDAIRRLPASQQYSVMSQIGGGIDPGLGHVAISKQNLNRFLIDYKALSAGLDAAKAP